MRCIADDGLYYGVSPPIISVIIIVVETPLLPCLAGFYSSFLKSNSMQILSCFSTQVDFARELLKHFFRVTPAVTT